MVEKVFVPILILLVAIVPDVAAAYTPPVNRFEESPLADNLTIDYVSPQPSILTPSRFSEEEISVSMPIPFDTEYLNDSESEIGTEKILQEGIAGQRMEAYLVRYWSGEETERILFGVKIEPSIKQVVLRGTKIIWRDLETEDYGNLKYWRKSRVWATSYDGNCFGCRGRTYSGTLVRHGTLAVDPSVIPLGTRIYIPGYGIGRAEDIGGGVKGERIDLGFEDVSSGWWHAQWADIYLLD